MRKQRAQNRFAGGSSPGIGVHAKGFIGDTDRAARDAFFPGWTHMFTEIGGERGWSRPSRPRFDAMCGPGGVFLIGSPETVHDKVPAANEALGGLSRITFQTNSAMLTTEAMERSTRGSERRSHRP